MIIFIHGTDTFRSRAKLTELREAFKKKYDPAGQSEVALDSATTSPADLRAATSTLGLFSARRLIVISGLLAAKQNKTESETALQILMHHAPESVIILYDDTSKEKAAAHGLVKAFAGRPPAETVTYVFDPLPARDLLRWLQTEIKKRALVMEPRALEALADLGNDLWRQTATLDQLESYTAGRPMLARDVELLARPPVSDAIFACMDAVADHDPARAAALVRQERAADVEDTQLMAMLIRQFRLILMAQSYDATHPGARRGVGAMARDLGVHPFVAGKLTAQSRCYTPGLARRHFEHLFELDQEIKSGRVTPAIAVDLFIGALATATP